jgi:coenzyme PQQ precursor peptide PqqA
MHRPDLAPRTTVEENHREPVGIPALLDVERVAASHRKMLLRKRLERRIESRVGGIHAVGHYQPLAHENHDFAERTAAGAVALHHNALGRVRGFAERLSTQETHMWTKPEYTEMRFGFEVTMYIASR